MWGEMEKFLKSFLSTRTLSPSDAASITTAIMNGEATPAQIGAFLVGLKLTSLETDAAIISAVAGAMRAASLIVAGINSSSNNKEGVNRTVVDIVGTGGDGQNTFNVSTAAAIVAAGAGCTVAKVRDTQKSKAMVPLSLHSFIQLFSPPIPIITSMEIGHHLHRVDLRMFWRQWGAI